MHNGRYAGAAAMLAALAAAVVAQGGYAPAGQRLVALLLAGALTVTLLTHHGTSDRSQWWVVATGSALAGWALVDGALHGDVGGGVRPAGLVVGVVGVLVAARALTTAGRDLLVVGLLVVGLLVAATGWLGVALHRAPWGLPGQGGWRAASTLTYPNAAAAVLAPLALVALARLAAERHPPARAGLAAVTAALLAGLGATGSRGGLLALAVGAGVLAGRLRGRLRYAAAALPGAAVALAGLLPSVAETGPARPVPALAAAVAGVALAARLAHRPPRLAVGLTAAGAVGLLAAALATPALAARWTLASPDRAGALGAAGRLVRDSPLTGTGPGQADLRWRDGAGVAHAIAFAHNEYVQVAAELGLIGAVLLVALLVAVGVAVRRDAAGTAVLAAVAVAAALDFGWHLPAVPLLTAALLGLALPRPCGADRTSGAAAPVHDPVRDRVPVPVSTEETS